MRSLVLVPLTLAAALLATSAQAQCESCASGDMLLGTIQSNIDYTTNQRMIDDTKQHDKDVYLNKRESGRTAQSPVPEAVLNQTQTAAMAALNPEYNRRRAAFGQASASRWMNAAARSVGTQVGSLAPEYRRRVRSEGRANADSWYVGRAREISRKYVQTSR